MGALSIGEAGRRAVYAGSAEPPCDKFCQPWERTSGGIPRFKERVGG